ncbi:taud/tfda taurine catabolism dioxygenase [Sarocladium strictum]
MASVLQQAGHPATHSESTITSSSQSLSNVSEFPFELFSIPGERRVHGHVFPLGIRVKPGVVLDNLDTAVVAIEELAGTPLFTQLVTNSGAILFRGLPVTTAEDFSKVAKAFKYPQPHQEVGLSGKRSTLGDNVKTANEEPPHVKFYFHNEYGRSAHFPGILFFNSQKVPDEGGQTPLLSTIELYDRVKEELPEFLANLIEKGIAGRQYYPAKDDPEAKTIGWNWRDSYGFDIQDTDDLETQRRKVEHTLKTRLSAEAEWQPNGALHVLQKLPAVRRIGTTGQPVLFNGLGGVYGRQRDREALDPPHRGNDGQIHLPTTYGDGSPIPYDALERYLEISGDIGFLVPWENGDVALVNNYTVQHARTPWKGERSLLVSLWDGHEKFVPY